MSASKDLRSQTVFFFGMLLFLSVTVAGCSKQTDISELVLRKGVVYEKKTGKPFSGVAVAWHTMEKTQKKSQTEYREGLMDGTEVLWYSSGEIMARRKYMKGVLHGESIMWYVNGQKKSVETYDEGRQYGRQTYWKKDGRLLRDRMIH